MKLFRLGFPSAVVCAALTATALAPSAASAESAQEARPREIAAETPAEHAADTTPRFESAVEVEAEATVPASAAVTRMAVPVTELPVSVSVVPRRLLDEQAALVLADALENASGVNVAAGFGVFDYFVIRGFDSLTSGLVLTDGVPEPESTFYPLYNVRQVDVLKGPSGFLHGGNPLSGAVVLARKHPVSRRFADVSLGYGRFGSFEGAFDGNLASAGGRLLARLNATWQGSDSHRDLAAGSIFGVNPTLSWRPDPRTRVGLDLEYVASGWPPDTGIPFVGEGGDTLAPVPRQRSYQSRFDDSQQDLVRLRLDAERRLGDALTVRNRLYFTELAWDSTGTLVLGTFPGPDGRLLVPRSLVRLDDRQRLSGNQLELLARFRTGPLKHELLAGLELRRLEDRFTQEVGLLPPLDLLDPAKGGEEPVTRLPQLEQRGDGRSLVLAPYAVDRVRLSAKVQAYLGARLDRLDHEDPATATEREDSSWSPLLGAVYSPIGALALHASYGRAYAPPSTQVVGPREPERGQQAELGARLNFLGGRGVASVSAYDLRREQVAIPDSTGFRRQTGSQRSRGLELELVARPAAGWSARAGYAYTDATLTEFAEVVTLAPPDFVVVDRSGNRAPFAPRHILGLWASRELGRLGASLGLRHVSEQAVSEDNRYAIAPWTTLDAAFSYALGRARVRVNLRNLTGAEYAARGFGAASAIPARPFDATARLELGFGRR